MKQYFILLILVLTTLCLMSCSSSMTSSTPPPQHSLKTTSYGFCEDLRVIETKWKQFCVSYPYLYLDSPDPRLKKEVKATRELCALIRSFYRVCGGTI
jgi:hypothetical protein